MAVTVTLAGVDITEKVERFQRVRRVNTVGVLSLWCVDTSGTVRPTPFETVTITVDATTIFAGTVARVQMTTVADDTVRAIQVWARDAQHALQRVVVNQITDAGSLESVLDALAGRFTEAGLTLDPSQATGPDVPEMGWGWMTLEAVVNELSRLTGWVYEVTAAGVFSMWAIGTRTAPSTFSEANGNIDGGPGWEQEHLEYRNGQWVNFGGSAPEDTEKTDRWEGDGATRLFTPRYWVKTRPGLVYHEPTASLLPLGTKGVDTHLEWVWDEANQRIEQLAEAPAGVFHDPLDPGEFLEATYVVLFPMAVYVDDAAEIAARGLWVRVDTNDGITDIDAAEAWGEALIRQSVALPVRLTLPTRTVGSDPGEVCTVTIPELDVSGSYLIEAEEILYRPRPDDETWLTVRLELNSGDERAGSWVDWWRARLNGGGAGGGGGVSVSGGAATVPGTGRVYADLGGSRSGVVSGGTLAQPVPDWRRVYLDPAWFTGGTGTIRVEVQTLNAGTSVTPQLRRLDTGATVWAGSATASTTMETQTGAVSFPVAGEYALYLVRSNGNASARGLGAVHG